MFSLSDLCQKPATRPRNKPTHHLCGKRGWFRNGVYTNSVTVGFQRHTFPDGSRFCRGSTLLPLNHFAAVGTGTISQPNQMQLSLKRRAPWGQHRHPAPNARVQAVRSKTDRKAKQGQRILKKLSGNATAICEKRSALMHVRSLRFIRHQLLRKLRSVD